MSDVTFDKFDFQNIFGDNKKKISRKMIKSMGFLMKIQMMIIKFQQKINRLQKQIKEDPDENLTQIDEFQLSRKIQMFQRGMHVSSDEEEDFQNVIDDTELRHKHTQDNEKGQHLKQLEKHFKIVIIFQETHKKPQKNQKTEKVFQETTQIGTKIYRWWFGQK
ncbi:hypothetical protein pb186bvf_020013 [Paramecium bursaria]